MRRQLLQIATLSTSLSAVLALAPRAGAQGPIASYGRYAENRTVTCESYDGRPSQCRIPEGSQVQLVERLSSAPCFERSTWGTGRGYIWVTNGCRARFAVNSGYDDRDDRDWDRDGDRDGGRWRGAMIARAQDACRDEAREARLKVRGFGEWTRGPWGGLRTEMWVKQRGREWKTSCVYDPRNGQARIDWRN
jgi:hypothetical protein